MKDPVYGDEAGNAIAAFIFKSGLAAIYGERLRGVDVLVVLDEVPRYGAEVDRTGELIANLSLAYERDEAVPA
jgi:hypothetical protein